MKTLVILFIAICAQTLGDVFLTKGMKSIGEVNTLDPVALLHIGVQVFTNPLVWLGIIILSAYFGLYLIALSWADLSFVLPVTAFGYTLNALMAWRLLGEYVSPVRWLGTIIICLGVAVVARTEQRTTKPPAGANAE
jgi:bacterial/archaeal transporter family protein